MAPTAAAATAAAAQVHIPFTASPFAEEETSKLTPTDLQLSDHFVRIGCGFS